MTLNTLLENKIPHQTYRQSISEYARHLSPAEQQLLLEILQNFSFDEEQAQALTHAVRLQSRFDPAAHQHDDDEDTSGVCQHCLNPPAPPLRDYYLYRSR